ncbi:MAG: glycosyltransferase family 2 protein [Endomicrobiales bacterium]|nr:glycosyltransferase family 2 protein [Endomicrobiales bacterium]
MEKIKISAVTIIFNEEINIDACLSRLTWADEIVVIDSFSTDKSLELCRKYTNKIFQKHFNGYAGQRNYGIEKASGEWILFVDADEIITDELKNEILQKTEGATDVSAYYIPRDNISFGKLLRHGGNYPDYQLRLFKKTSATYREEIHEKLEIRGGTAYLQNPMVHRNYQTISEYLKKLNSYTDLEVKKMVKNNEKVTWLQIIFKPAIRFFWTYFIKLGFMDGYAGFLMSGLGSVYMFMKYIKYKRQ